MEGGGGRQLKDFVIHVKSSEMAIGFYSDGGRKMNWALFVQECVPVLNNNV